MAPPGARPHRAAALAQALGGRLHGPDAWVSGVASWSRAGPDDLVFAEAALPESCGAGLVLARSALPGRSVIIVEDPRLSFILAIDILCPQRDVPGIHPTATVHPSARLGQGLTLHAGVVIGADCEIGDGCVLFPNVVLYPRTQLGRRVRIHAGAVLGADGFSYHQSPTGLHKMPQLGRVVVGDDVEIGANACIDRGALDDTVICAGAKIDNLVQVGHNCQIGAGAILAAQVGLSGSVVLGEGVLLGGQVGVADHRRIGAGAQVGAQSGVSKDLPGAARYFGTPALPIARARRMVAALRLLPDQLAALRRRREDPESD